MSESPAAAVIEHAVPPGYMRDVQGRLVPEGMVKPIDRLRDQTVLRLVEQARVVNDVLRSFKHAAFQDIATFISTSAEQYDVKLGGEKGNVTLHSFDGRYRVVRQVQELVRFDERLQAAKKLIDECITDWSTDSRDEIKVLVNDAFKVDKEGDVSVARVSGLRRLNITDAKWVRAMKAISDAMTVVGSSSYVRVYERIGDSDQYRAIPLDVAAV
jgi:Protein of unknown function (DUF3164)